MIELDDDFESIIISKTDINGNEISTVKLPRVMRKEKPYETAIFWQMGGSEVVARYRTEMEAISGHEFWAKKIAKSQETN